MTSGWSFFMGLQIACFVAAACIAFWESRNGYAAIPAIIGAILTFFAVMFSFT